MKLRKYIATCAVVTMFGAILLAGCGGNNDKPESTPEAAVEKTEEPAKATEAPEDNKPKDASQMSLKDEYKDLFSIGVAVNSWQLADQETLDVITKDFSSFTCENEMKPDYVLDYDKTIESEDGMPEINTENMDKIMTMAEEAGLKMRGHTLVWHSQTPEWLFHEDYDEDKDYVDKDTMLERMEAYIKKVLTFCNEKHPGTVYAWDVVNEPASDDKGLREDSPWFKTIGKDYIEKAFEYARKYAGEGVKLFLNDYNTEVNDKRNVLYNVVRNLHEKGLIDGFGMQSHHDREYYNADEVKATITRFAQLEGLEIQLTELDMHYNDNSEEAMTEQAEAYRAMFDILVELDKEGLADITNVTFWGLNDGSTWLTAHKQEDSYPLLFDKDNVAKPCYYSIFDAVAASDK
ncbi:MAG: endo-1,4-beta-xylanase [Lachnospiraceae bacterium]|nr:endo-1,4-beta-xylanase [Lachnospiraceae bacterium]